MTRHAQYVMCTSYRYVLLLLFTLAGVGLLGCGEELPEPIVRDLDAIQERDTLVALTTFNSTSTFLYRGEMMGFEYDLLQAFAEEADVNLKVIVVSDRDSLFHLLNEGVGDVVAARIIPAAADTNDVLFTNALYETQPAVVQRQGPPSQTELPSAVEGTIDDVVPDTSHLAALAEVPDSFDVNVQLVRQPSELVGDTVHVPSNPAYVERLIEIEDAQTGDIHVVVAEGDVSQEALIRQVSAGAINLTVSQANVAELRESYFSNITVRPQVGPPARVAWATRTNATELHASLNEWIEEQRDGELLQSLYQRYFVDRRGYIERITSEYLTPTTGKISPYDELLQAYAPLIEWDWRLLAAQTYQESRFDPVARSWAGASGLLQLMPATAREFGVDNVFDPEQNVEGAVRFLEWLEDYWADKIPDAEERMKFILASYNAGHGHVEDARRLAEENGDDPLRWDEVAYWMLQLSKREVYTRPVVKYGFVRGLEPVSYVSLILNRWENYRQFTSA